MRAVLEPLDAPGSLRVSAFELDRFRFFWHHHPETELTVILSGRGRRHVGDHVADYGPGDVVLLGPDLPHAWISEPDSPRNGAVVAQVRVDGLGTGLLDRPELTAVRDLLGAAGRGLSFPPDPAFTAAMQPLAAAPALRRLLGLLELLDGLAARRAQATALASPGYEPGPLDRARRRMDEVRAHIVDHHAEPLTLSDVAAVAHLSPSSLSRAFRATTGQTFTAHLNEVRVGAACRELVETDLTVAAIASQVGYANLANFNRRFRELRGTTPTAYRRRFRLAAASAA